MKPRLPLIAALAAGLAGGAGAVALASGDGEDDVAPIVVEASSSGAARGGDLVVEDGIPAADARRIGASATRSVPGTAVSVERDDGMFEATVRTGRGDLAEVKLDDRFRVVGVDADD